MNSMLVIDLNELYSVSGKHSPFTVPTYDYDTTCLKTFNIKMWGQTQETFFFNQKPRPNSRQQILFTLRINVLVLIILKIFAVLN